MPFYGVKLPKLQAVWTGYGRILPLEKWTHFVLGPWLLVCQFIDISNQIETTGEVSSVEQKNLYNALLCKKILSIFDTSPVVHFFKGRILPYPVHTACSLGSFTP